MRLAFAGLAVIALVLPVAACSSPVGGNPGPSDSTGSTGSPPTGTSQRARAPRVAEPLEPEPFVADVCRTIAADQAGGLKLTTPGRKTSNAAGPGCLWWVEGRQTSVAVNYFTTLTAGLSALYVQHEQEPSAFKYFEPATVAGYPGLYADKLEAREDGACTLNIGVTDELFMNVLVDHLPKGKDVCDLAARVGEAVIETMKRGA